MKYVVSVESSLVRHGITAFNAKLAHQNRYPKLKVHTDHQQVNGARSVTKVDYRHTNIVHREQAQHESVSSLSTATSVVLRWYHIHRANS